jgi:hypothetical protein
MEREVELPPGEGSVYAAEGTAAHALAFLRARHEILGGPAPDLDAWRETYRNVVEDEEDMRDHVSGYLDFLREQLEEPGSVLLLEQRVPTGVPSCWGTSDAVVVSPRWIHVIDLKYGKGVEVSALENPQLRLYGVGALEAFGDLLGYVERVAMTVYQPRIHNVETEEITALHLRAWRDSIIPIAEEALGHNARFGPSDTACRWCPAAGQCRAQLEWATAMDFGAVPETITGAELEAALNAIPAIEAWCAAVKQYALDLVYSQGGEIPGYKVVMSGGKRKIPNEELALEALELIGFTFDQVGRRKLKTLGDLEKLLRRSFDTVLGPFVEKGDSSPSLVPVTDSRPSVTPNTEASREFRALVEGESNDANSE